MEKKRQPNFTSDEVEVLTSAVEKRAKLLFWMLSAALQDVASTAGCTVKLAYYYTRVIR